MSVFSSVTMNYENKRLKDSAVHWNEQEHHGKNGFTP